MNKSPAELNFYVTRQENKKQIEGKVRIILNFPPHVASWFVCADMSYACVTSLVDKPQERRHLEKFHAEERMILK
jgi:hypothetical protein